MSGAPQIYKDRTVLITGGTKGIGLGTALVFAAHGAQTILTCRWGSADPDEVAKLFTDIGAPAPLIIEADVANSEDTKTLFETLKERSLRIDAFISNASNAVTVQSLDDLTERAFLKSMRASTWPTVEYTLACRKYLGHYPRYVVVMSSDGPDRFTPAYDFVAASKASVEALSRYLAYRLKDEDFRINIVRSRAIKTDAFTDTFGNDFYGFLRRFVPDEWFVTVEEVANATFALCSGPFDAMNGQTLMVDRGNTFADGISFLYEKREQLEL